MKLKITQTDDKGNSTTSVRYHSLKQLVWDALLTAENRDEKWNNIDTCKLIVDKLIGGSKISCNSCIWFQSANMCRTCNERSNHEFIKI